MASSFERSASHLHWLSQSEIHFTEDDYTKWILSLRFSLFIVKISQLIIYTSPPVLIISLCISSQFLSSLVISFCSHLLGACSICTVVLNLTDSFSPGFLQCQWWLWSPTLEFHAGPGRRSSMAFSWGSTYTLTLFFWFVWWVKTCIVLP